jgi:hypothetical protein
MLVYVLEIRNDMKTKTITTYSYNELTGKAKERAYNTLAKWASEDWFNSIDEDAKQIGLNITDIDVDRRECNGEFLSSAMETADLIISNHGKDCDTTALANNFISTYDKLVEKYSDGEDLSKVTYENEYEFDGLADELEDEFLKDLLQEYLIMARKEIEFQSSEDYINEFAEGNDYEFDELGKIV